MIGNRDPSKQSSANRGADADREVLLDALSDPLRRVVLRELDPDEGRVELSDLAERVADDVDAPPSTVEIRLHHSHLPMLADRGLVAYDYRETAVEATPLPAATRRYLDSVLGV